MYRGSIPIERLPSIIYNKSPWSSSGELAFGNRDNKILYEMNKCIDTLINGDTINLYHYFIRLIIMVFIIIYENHYINCHMVLSYIHIETVLMKNTKQNKIK